MNRVAAIVAIMLATHILSHAMEISLTNEPPSDAILIFNDYSQGGTNTYLQQYAVGGRNNAGGAKDPIESGQSITPEKPIQITAVTFQLGREAHTNVFPDLDLILSVVSGWTNTADLLGSSVTRMDVVGPVGGFYFEDELYMTLALEPAETAAIGTLEEGTEYGLILHLSNAVRGTESLFISRSDEKSENTNGTDYALGQGIFDNQYTTGHALRDTEFYVQGTAVSTLDLLSIGGLAAGQPVELSWSSTSGSVYRVMRLGDLATGTWTAVATNLPADPPVNILTNYLPTAAQEFYRVEEE